jgi:hypothetical protein
MERATVMPWMLVVLEGQPLLLGDQVVAVFESVMDVANRHAVGSLIVTSCMPMDIADT